VGPRAPNRGLAHSLYMNLDILLVNLINPVILFFFVGFSASLMKSDLEIPQPLPKFFSIYLLSAIGFKGGVELHKNGFTTDIVLTLLAAITMAFVVPIYSFFILKLKMDAKNAAAIAATYGSVSAVTFITAKSFPDTFCVSYWRPLGAGSSPTARGSRMRA